MEDIQQELRAVDSLCRYEPHRNIVAVTKYGRLDFGSFYFLDTELCDLNLDNYIYRQWTSTMHQDVTYFTTEPSSHMRMGHIWKIMEDVNNGVAFIHQRKQIHETTK